jgi:hypothetical protein
MTDVQVQLVVAAGLFSLGGVALGALLAPLTQLYLQKKQEQRAAASAKLLVAGELLHAQLILRSASTMSQWPPVEDVNAFLPTSAWQENRSSLAGKVHEDLWEKLVLAYALLETDRARFVSFSRSPSPIALPAKEAQGLKLFSYELGQLRRQLGGGSGWLDEIHYQLKPRIASLNDDFKQMLDGLSDDDLKKGAVIAEVKQRAKELGELNRDLGDDGAWSAEINEEIERRLK